MSELLLIPSTLVYLLVVGMLFVYGINFFYLTYISLKKRRKKALASNLQSWPEVTVQLPIYNEMYVAKRLIEAATQLDYPQELLEIQVLDDSTDETTDIIKNTIDKLRAAGHNLIHVHRVERSGYKAGALAEGLKQASGEFLAIFDADFIPSANFLKRTLPLFNDPRTGFIQTRWGHINSDYSFLTHLQSLAIDAHFMIEQDARARGGYWFNFNGTAGIWRKSTIIDAGGWTADTLTEDLDLSYRSFLRGWRAKYLRDLVVPAELPVSFSAYRRQQHRWAKGSLECAIKYIPVVWNRRLPWKHKLEATLHLTGYFVHLLLFALVLMYPVVLYLSRQYPELISLFGIATFFNATAFAPTIFFLTAQKQLDSSWWKKIPAILFISALGSGMMVNTLRAAFQILANKNAAFERTPKFGITRRDHNWFQQRYQIKLDPIIFFELGLAVFNLGTTILAVQSQNWFIAVYAAIFCTGLFFTSGTTLMQSIKIYRNRGHVPPIKARKIERHG